MLPLALIIVLASFFLVRGYKSSQPNAPRQNSPAPESPPRSDLMTAEEGNAPTAPTENASFTAWLDQFNQKQEPHRAAETIGAEEKRLLVDYLVASARIAWPQDPVALREALLENKDGKPTKLDAVIRGFEAGVTELKKISAPERLTAVHEATLSQLADLIGVYKDLRADSGKSITETWQGPTMAGLRERSAQTLEQIRELVSRYQLQLPDDVLPPYAL